MQLAGKKILLAVTGSIAAYKTAFFVRGLIKQGAEVKIIMTESATHFITPLTLSTLSKNPVLTSFYKTSNGEWNNHVELGLWADLIVIAPLSANTLSKLATGSCDNLLVATYLSARCPVMLAPAMDLDMYKHKTTVENLNKVKSFGNIVIEAKDGELASGLSGVGRMAEPEELVQEVVEHFKKSKDFEGINVLITSGPTQEGIDAVRYVSNHSSGKMGLHIAQAFAEQGANVTFISGPVTTYPKHPNIDIVNVTTALEMLSEVKKYHGNSQVSVFTAAVSDYRPKEKIANKKKRDGESLNISLVENPDIAKEMGLLKRKDQVHVGFALETDNEEEYAKRKLEEKNFDLIVLNSMNEPGAGFGVDTNKVTFYEPNNKSTSFELKNKSEVALDILKKVSEYNV